MGRGILVDPRVAAENADTDDADEGSSYSAADDAHELVQTP